MRLSTLLLLAQIGALILMANGIGIPYTNMYAIIGCIPVFAALKQEDS